MSNQIDLLQSLDLEKIRASSRKAAWGSLVGGVIVVSAIVFSVIRIGMLDQEVATRTEQLTDLKEQIEPLKSTQKELETQVSSKKTELVLLQAQLATTESRLKMAKEQELIALAKEKEALAKEQDALARKNDTKKQLDVARDNKAAFEDLVSANFSKLNDMGAMKDPVELLRVGVVPRASADPFLEDSGDAAPNFTIQKAPQDSGTAKRLFKFSLWIDYRDEKVKQIAAANLESVTYTFNHVSFGKDEKGRRRTSKDKTNGYREGYVGWGAMTNVIIELRLRNGKVARLDFDMHAALPSELGVPIKGSPNPSFTPPPAVRD